jgi:hypothetical protein
MKTAGKDACDQVRDQVLDKVLDGVVGKTRDVHAV